MAAAYDTYNYPSYWEGRDYEHESEKLAIKSLLQKIPVINTALDIGGGFGRLVPSYSFRAKKVILSDPSSKLLKTARESINDPKVEFLHAKLDTLGAKLKRRRVDLAVMVRVLHHIDSPDEAFKTVYKILNPKGYFLLEFANKTHSKAILNSFLKGDFTYLLDIFPIDIRSKKNKKKKTLPFINFHPDDIIKKLEDVGFEVVDKRSVSNIRSDRIKARFPLELLLVIESYLQKILARFNFGPSIFVLLRKRD